MYLFILYFSWRAHLEAEKKIRKLSLIQINIHSNNFLHLFSFCINRLLGQVCVTLQRGLPFFFLPWESKFNLSVQEKHFCANEKNNCFLLLLFEGIVPHQTMVNKDHVKVDDFLFLFSRNKEDKYTFGVPL